MTTNNELLTRAVSNVKPDKLANKKLESGKPIRLYLGIDPTGSKLHLGHSVPLRKLKAFADAGHEVVFLVGSFTATIGDPTGQDKMREPITKEQVKKNFKTYKKQAGKILDFKKVKIRYNTEWYDKMNAMDFFEINSHFTVQQMMQRDMFKERMKWKVICNNCKELSDSPIQFQSTEDKDSLDINETEITCSHCEKRTLVSKETIIPPPNPVSPQEIMYPIMQGYDSVMLDVDCEIGGNDQLFNMLCGRKLQKIYGKREKFVLTTKLVEGTDGRKMSKTYDNCIWLEDSANDMFGKTMSINDELMETYFECCTDVPMNEVKEIVKGNPRDAKVRLAKEIVSLYHGEKAAQAAVKQFDAVFRGKGIPDDIKEVKVKKGTFLLDVLVKHELIPSKSEGRRLIKQNGITVNEKPVKEVEALAEEGTVKVGKRKFLKIKIS
ncbi:tyrosine--tRNA ligase [Candidatus Peregrinibacteria bacterium]|mgnify:CR=1 FL=1|jgi:tyrosyl-tRNA synthetase|nr:tyrosine--tRNA ligase [Candidatus Peregrinibacteria bacterium]MBT3598264.1 tyrosine--tRNA ligase [Candidatus Peregrinibacteria bacterium]MBT4367545.1 tyrosine--tRNA ligase [Candidatus Peregrinibacteria bacterium]MBT4585520.1 tyrosine--tRNA ligase [Candidatus Peregrinibacteria bacterium]MBT6731335.1 tyrosine--tRNA ligase [Candidatus Peregrinibacteria bacterium]